MKKIRDTYIRASQGFWAIDPNTGSRIDEHSYRVLRSQWIAHRKANGLPWQEVEKWIHEQVCAREGGNYCVDSETGLPEPSLMAMVGNATKSFAIWMLNGMPVASNEEIEKRASICKGCEFFDKYGYGGVGKCTVCGCSGLKIGMQTEKCPKGKW